MDVLTQGLLGGALAQSLARPEEKRSATCAGIVAGMLADADILIRSTSDPLLTLEYHRHFTHALIFIPAGALIALLLLWPFLRRRISASRLYLFCLAGFSMSGLLDACTSYGTHLFWPFSDERVAFNIIAIVDPVFTAVLFLCVVTGLRYRHAARTGLILCAGYLLFGFVQQQRATAEAEGLISSRGHDASVHVVKPTLGNQVLWRSVYIHNEHLYVDAVRVGLFKENIIYTGNSVPVLNIQRDLPGLSKQARLYRDIERFRMFSSGYVAIDPEMPGVIGDIRYSMLPMSTKPLWGIVIDAEQPDRHADYRFFRDTGRETRQTFIKMVLGN